jgi:hypothetical protein
VVAILLAALIATRIPVDGLRRCVGRLLPRQHRPRLAPPALIRAGLPLLIVTATVALTVIPRVWPF